MGLARPFLFPGGGVDEMNGSATYNVGGWIGRMTPAAGEVVELKRSWKPLPEDVKLAVLVPTYDGRNHGDLTKWLVGALSQLTKHPRLDRLFFDVIPGYPVTRLRNAFAYQAMLAGFDFLLMIDEDTVPDVMVGGNEQFWIQPDPGAKPFLPTVLDFALAHDGPCVVAAPYCGGPPKGTVFVNTWQERYVGHPDTGMGVYLDPVSRHEAAQMTGFQPASAVATGCLFIDLRVFAVLPKPWFEYEYGDSPLNTKWGSTEDTVFSRACSTMGIPLYAAWDSWAGHWKPHLMGKPQRLDPKKLMPAFRDLLLEQPAGV